MKLLVCCLALALIIGSCQYKNTALQERLEQADSAAINFFKGDGSMDTVVAVRIIRDKAQLIQLSQFLSEKSVSEKPSCGEDASIHYFKGGVVMQDVYIGSKRNNCNRCFFVLNGERQNTELSSEARTFIQQLHP